MSVENQTTSEELNLQTRMRLLEVAGEVFAESGYRGATIREICQRAGANVAAVNYHFRDKDGLYAECLRHFLSTALQKYPPTWGLSEQPTGEERLHAFVRSFLYRILDQSRHAWYGKLIARNMVEPSPFLDICIEQSVRPMAQRLHEIVREIVGPKLSEEQVKQACLNIMGQIVFHRHSQPVISRLFPEMKYDHADLDRLANNITQFSIAGLKALGKQENNQH